MIANRIAYVQAPYSATKAASWSSKCRTKSISSVMAAITAGSRSLRNYSSLAKTAPGQLIGQRLAAGFGREPDQHHSDHIDQRNQRAGQRMPRGQGNEAQVPIRGQRLEQIAHLQHTDRRQDAAEIEAEALPSRPDIRRKELRQIKRQPTIKRRRECPGNQRPQEQAESKRVVPQKEHPRRQHRE